MDVLAFDDIVKLCVDTYSVTDIEVAKSLVFDVCREFSSRRLIRRQGLNKSQSNVQDIVTLLLEVDPENIPTFVAQDLTKLPPVDYNYVDMSSLLSKFNRMKVDLDCLKTEVTTMSSLYLRTAEDISQINHKIGNFVLGKVIPQQAAEKQCTRENSTFHADEFCDNTVSDIPPATHVRNNANEVVCDDTSELMAACDAESESVNEVTPDTDNNDDGFTTVLYGRRKRNPSSYADAVVQGKKSDLSTCKLGESLASAPPPATVTQQTGDKIWRASRRNFMLGNKKDTSILSAANPKSSLFVTRLQPDTTPDHIISYIGEMLHINVVSCVQLKTKHRSYASFCVTVNAMNLKTLQNPNSWPEGVLIRKFYQPRKQL
ncbi:uncharacterized protein [Ptychodera flava]|uniref:uncharacterized protein n=1 Tax=Ptychodera flava TaxID=63121 RepID=UPI00396A5937